MDFIRRNVKIVVLLACFAASLSPIFIRLAEGIPPMAVGFYRLTFGLPFFIATSLIYHREEIRKISKRQLRGSAMAGVFFPAFLNVFHRGRKDHGGQWLFSSIQTGVPVSNPYKRWELVGTCRNHLESTSPVSSSH